jgi:hypothetical protein
MHLLIFCITMFLIIVIPLCFNELQNKIFRDGVTNSYDPMLWKWLMGLGFMCVIFFTFYAIIAVWITIGVLIK